MPRLRLRRRHRAQRRVRRPAPAMVVGAGTAGRALVRALRYDPAADVTPVGLLDDNDILYRVCGLPVLGGTDEIGRVAVRTGARMVLLAIPSLPRPRAADLIDRAWAAGLTIRALPPGGRTGRDLRDLRQSWVLGREEIAVASERARHLVANRRVLVTGAGGTVGSALCRWLTRLEPAALCMVDLDGAALDRLRLEIGGAGRPAADRVVTARADVRDLAAVTAAFDELRPQVVFHAAQCGRRAELERDPAAGVLTNVRGTHNVVDAAVRCGVTRLVVVSADSAADPASVFGVTKRLSELVPQTYAGGETRFAAVRIGDILGAPGSPLPEPAGRLARNETISVAHPDAARRFMTVGEAAGLILEAAALAEQAETFVLDVGGPVPVVELVHRYAEQLRVPAVSIRFTGLGPGERLAEHAFSATERPVPTAHPRVLAIRPSPVPAGLLRLLDSLYVAAAHGDEDAIRRMLRQVVI